MVQPVSKCSVSLRSCVCGMKSSNTFTVGEIETRKRIQFQIQLFVRLEWRMRPWFVFLLRSQLIVLRLSLALACVCSLEEILEAQNDFLLALMRFFLSKMSIVVQPDRKKEKCLSGKISYQRNRLVFKWFKNEIEPSLVQHIFIKAESCIFLV